MTTLNANLTPENRYAWQIPDSHHAEIDAELDRLQIIISPAECVMLSGPGIGAFGSVEETGDCTDAQRYACEANIFEDIDLDGRGVLADQLSAGLRDRAQRLVDAADAIDQAGQQLDAA